MSAGYSIAALVGRLKLAIGRGRIQQSDDSKAIQFVQIALGPKELMTLKRVAEYGFQSWPPDNCDAIAVFLGGDRSNGAVIATHDLASRFKLGNKGESVFFDNSGAGGKPGRWIWWKLGATPSLEIEANNTDVVLNHAKSVTLNVGAGGMVINATGDVVLNMNGHNFIINGAGAVELDGAGGKKVALDQDPVVAGKVVASSTVVTAK